LGLGKGKKRKNHPNITIGAISLLELRCPAFLFLSGISIGIGRLAQGVFFVLNASSLRNTYSLFGFETGDAGKVLVFGVLAEILEGCCRATVNPLPI
jgi:hypothetical protein